MNCAEVRAALPAYVRNGEISLEIRRHVSTCPGCKSELSLYELLLDALDSLESKTADVPASLTNSLVAVAAGAGTLHSLRSHLVRNRTVYVGSVAVAVAGATGALLLHRRSAAA